MGFIDSALNVINYIGYVFPFINAGYSYWGKAVDSMTPKPSIPDSGALKRTVANPTLARRVIYGERVVGGQIAFWGVTGHQQNMLHMVVVFAAHEVDSIVEVYLNGRAAASMGASTTRYLGTLNQISNSYLRTMFPAKWGINHKLTNLAYVRLDVPFNESNFPNGIPNVEAKIRGAKVYDPRTGLTAWSDNNALCLRDWLVRTGKAGSNERIDDSLVITAADRCDELINGVKRHTCNGVLELSGSPRSGIDALAASMGGIALYRQGKWRIYSSSYEAPTVTINESHLNGPISVVARGDKSKVVNIVRGKYHPTNKNHIETDFPPLKYDSLIADDLEELPADITLPFTTNLVEAQRLAKLYLMQSRATMAVEVPLKARGLRLAPFARVALDIEQLGWSGQIFRVDGFSAGVNGTGITVKLIEDAPSIWDWVPGEENNLDLPDATELPDPLVVPTPINLSATEGLYPVKSDLKTYAILSWGVPDGYNPPSSYIIQQQGPEDADWVQLPPVKDTQHKILDVASVTYQWRVKAQNTIGAESDWSDTYTYTVAGKDALPNAPAAVQASVRRDSIEIRISPSGDLDLALHEVRLGSVWDTAVPIGTVAYPSDTLLWQPTATGELVFLVRAKDTSEHWSLTATASNTLSVVPPQFDGAATLSQEVIDNNVLLKWPPAVGVYPIEGYRISRGATFETAVELRALSQGQGELIVEPTGGTFKYWVQPVDIFGNAGDPIATYATVSAPPDYVLMAMTTVDLSTVTCSSAVYDPQADAIVLPRSTTETWADHFGSRGWSTIQDQINAGFPLYAQPGNSSGYIEAVVDYGSALSCKITVDVTRTTLAGTITVTPKISVSSDNSTWTDYDGYYEVYGSGFRYIKLRLTVTGGDTTALAKISNIAIRLDVKEKSIGTKCTVSDTTGDGTQFNFSDLGITPIDVISIVAGVPFLNDSSKDPVKVAVNFTDAPYPTYYKLVVWDKNGTRIAANNIPVAIRYR